jgi:hypothetical protein
VLEVESRGIRQLLLRPALPLAQAREVRREVALGRVELGIGLNHSLA